MNPRKAQMETKDTNFAAILTLTGILIVVVGLSIWVTRLLHHSFMARLSQRDSAVTNRPPEVKQTPEPRLQVNPAIDMVRMRDVENVTLNNYAWVSSNEGLVRIPITRAMDIVARKGLPLRSTHGEKS